MAKLETSDRWLGASLQGPDGAKLDEVVLMALEGIINAYVDDWMLVDGDVLTFDVIAPDSSRSKVKIMVNVSLSAIPVT